MSLDPRSLARFAVLAGVLFGAFVLVYPWIAPGYRTALRVAANPLLRTLPDPARVETNEDGGWNIAPVSGHGTVFFVTPDDLDLNHAALILLPALLLATPGTARKRLERLAVGVGALFALHAVSIVPWVAALRCLRHHPDSLTCLFSYSVFGAGSQTYAFVVWGALTWRLWLPSGDPGAPTSRNARCPCGSGLKYKRCCGKQDPSALAT